MKYKLDCISHDEQHTTFRVFDRGTVGSQSNTPANCGTLVIQTEDLVFFLRNAWKGDIFWNGLCPVGVLDKQIANNSITGAR